MSTSLLIVVVLGLRPVPSAGQTSVPSDPVVLRADSSGIVLEWRAPTLSLQRVTGDDGHTYSVLEAPGWSQTDAPGQPRLPYASALAVVPPTGDVTVRVQTIEQTRRSLGYPVLPARAPVPVGTPPTGVEWEWALDERAYAENKSHPAEALTLEEAGWQRGRRLVRLTFHPVRFDPAGSKLTLTQRVRLELRFEGQSLAAAQGKGTSETGWGSDDPFIPVLENSVVNPGQVNDFARPRRTTSLSAGPVGMSGAAPTGADAKLSDDSRYKLIISHEGIYALTYDALAGAGIPVDTTPRTAYRLEHDGERVAYQWEGDGDDAFEPGERILFYARPIPTRFTDYDVYWLTVGATGTLMAARSCDPTGLPPGTAWATAVAEQGGSGQHHLSLYPSDRDGDRWYWDRLYWDATTGTGERRKDFSIRLTSPDGGAPEATLRVYLQGTTRDDALAPDHRVEVRLNGSFLGTTEWDGAVFHAATFSLPSNLLHVGDNTVRLRLPGNGARSGVEEVWLDALELRYGVDSTLGDGMRLEGEAGRNRYTVESMDDNVRIYDVTVPTTTQVLVGFTASSGHVIFGDADSGTATYYLLAEDQISAPDKLVQALRLEDPPAGADYLIIAHSAFIDYVAPLANYRATSDGMRVFSTTVEAIYDSPYGDGSPDPEAIKAYIQHAYEDWPGDTLSYVLLVGDGIEDLQGRFQSNATQENYIPPYMIEVWGYETASDNRFVAVDGPDNIADVFIGRFPVNTETQATNVVDKILAYELNPPQWPWNQRVLFMAGDESDAAYHQYSDDVFYNHLPSTLNGQRVYFCTSDCDEPHLYENINTARERTVHQVNIGGLLASYVGHSSIHQWAYDPQTYAPMFHLDDVASLHNGGALPLFLEMTCYTSHFSHPTDNTLDESLLRQADGGAIATWGPTTIGSVAGNNVLHPEFFDAVFQGGTTGLGPATETAKAHLPGYLSDMRDRYVLLGDPAMDLNLTVVPWSHATFLPVTLRNH